MKAGWKQWQEKNAVKKWRPNNATKTWRLRDRTQILSKRAGMKKTPTKKWRLRSWSWQKGNFGKWPRYHDDQNLIEVGRRGKDDKRYCKGIMVTRKQWWKNRNEKMIGMKPWWRNGQNETAMKEWQRRNGDKNQLMMIWRRINNDDPNCVE